MPDISSVKKLVSSNPIIRAAIEAGDVKVVYRRKPVLDAEWLFCTWTVEFAILDAEVVPLLEAALDRIGGEIERKTATRIITTFTLLLSSEEKKQLRDEQAQSALEEKEQAAAGVIAELQREIRELRESFQAQLREIREEAQLQTLVRRKPVAGPAGPRGEAGPPGRDLDATDVSISDLADVSPVEPENGQVLMWVELAQEYQPRRIPASGVSISGGGGGKGGGGGVQPENPGPGGPGNDQNNGWLLKWWYETDQGHFMPRTAGQNIGSADVPVKEIFVSGGSIVMDGHVVDLMARDGSDEVRLAYDGRILAYETYSDGEPVEPFADAPRDGYHYVRYMGTWVRLEELIPDHQWSDRVDGGLFSEIDCSLMDVFLDGGDFDTGQTQMGIHVGPMGGGDFNSGTPDGLGDIAADGGTLD